MISRFDVVTVRFAKKKITHQDTTQIMASEDPRALLRAARKERRVAHPHASYTSTGNLLCNLCECPIKSEAAWGTHLHSTGHTLRLSREQDAAAARKAEAGNGKKRKARSPVEGEDSDSEERKRAKGSGPGQAATTNQTVPSAQNAPTRAAAAEIKSSQQEHGAAELDALEADLAAMERESRANAARESFTISAPAQSADDLAAQAREEQSTQRGRRDAELEEEREDAARALEDEFAEMQTLEGRVKKLREKRELLRAGKLKEANGSAEGVHGDGAGDSPDPDRTGVDAKSKAGHNEDNDAAYDEDDDDDDDDDGFDDWTFGAR